jgi:superoxide dismutase, Cu-Zn family
MGLSGSLAAITLLSVGSSATVVGQAAPGQGPPSVRASFAILDTTGERIGQVTAIQESGGVLLQIMATGLPEGRHGLHLHAASVCEPPAFRSAGGHLNPEGKQHGRRNPAGPHLGDLPNLVIDEQREGRAALRLDGVTLTAGSRSIGVPGTALIIHASEDDELTDPAGNAGGRIACAAIAISSN